MTRVAVVGGGISGLAAAWHLTQAGGAEVTLVERESRLGGKIATVPFGGIELDAGPDAFLARVPAAAALAREAGLADDLVEPGTGQAWLWTRGRLRRLPAGLVLGVPTDLRALARSRVLPAPVTARAALDIVLPGGPVGPAEDVSVGALIKRRMGRGVQLGLVDPLIGGINAGHTDRLSAAVAAPQLLAAARRHRSLIRGLQASATSGTAGGAVIDRDSETGGGPGETGTGSPAFLTVRGGLGRLVDALAAGISTTPGTEIIVGDGAASLEPAGAGWAVGLDSDRTVTVDAVIIACPAAGAASLLGRVCPAAAAVLGSMATASVALTLLAYAQRAVPSPIEGSGFLVPRPEGRLITAASWVGNKWPHLQTPGTRLMRVSAGRVDDARAQDLDDDALVAAIHGELSSAMGLRSAPVSSEVHRWPDAFPQYEPGHLDRVAQAERRLGADAPGLVLAGAALRGVGIATCIAGARAAADRALQFAASPPVANPQGGSDR